MTRIALRAGAAATLAAALTLATAGLAAAEDYTWPRLLVIGATGTSGGAFASTNGWAPILQKETGMVVRVVPEDNEPMRFRRLTDRKDIMMTTVTAPEMRFQTEGIGGYAAAPPAAQRLIWHHMDSPWGYVTSGDSDIQSLEDLKRGGVRLTQGMFSPPMSFTVRNALPAYLGMTPEEAEKTITYVPASSYAENCRSVVEGKSDIAYCSPISSVLSEMEGAPGGIRWLDMSDENREGWEGYLQYRPMLVPGEITLGVKTAQGTKGAIANFFYTVTPEAEEDFVYNMAKWFHTSYDAYKGTHPLAQRMSLELFRTYLNRTPMPVHAGTVRYLREIGQWTEEDDAWNQAAAEQMDAWVAARKAAMQEARETGVEIEFQNEAFLGLIEKHTEGLKSFRSRL